MSDAAWALQTAIRTHLSGDDAIKSLIGDPPRIYDAPPKGAAFPYLVIGEGRLSDWSGVDGGMVHDLRLAAYCKYAGRLEVKAIMTAVYDALHEAELPLTGHRLINIRFVFADALRRRDGESYEGVMRYRAVTQALEG